jgi:hypothetical protein
MRTDTSLSSVCEPVESDGIPVELSPRRTDKVTSSNNFESSDLERPKKTKLFAIFERMAKRQVLAKRVDKEEAAANRRLKIWLSPEIHSTLRSLYERKISRIFEIVQDDMSADVYVISALDGKEGIDSFANAVRQKRGVDEVCTSMSWDHSTISIITTEQVEKFFEN